MNSTITSFFKFFSRRSPALQTRGGRGLAEVEALAEKYRNIRGVDLMRALAVDEVGTEPVELEAVAADIRRLAASVLRR